jgi:hypothetical protein
MQGKMYFMVQDLQRKLLLQRAWRQRLANNLKGSMQGKLRKTGQRREVERCY